MRLVTESGLWVTGPAVAPTPLVAVLEVSGAVLSWTVDEPSGAAATHITFTDVARADWLWRIVGESGHVATADALAAHAADELRTIELTTVALLPGSVDVLRRLAVGHWLRRWWPASRRDGIADLDPSLLDAEIALLTSTVEDFFDDNTLDSDVVRLLRPHAAALGAHARVGDSRVRNLVVACSELAEGLGLDEAGWSELSAALDDLTAPGDLSAPPTGLRDDYALAAGSDDGQRTSVTVATGVGSISWAGVPPGIFDAAEDTVDWAITTDGSAATATVRTALSGQDSAAGIEVRLSSGPVTGAGVLDARGRATMPLVDARRVPMAESTAWDHDWSPTAVTVGADVEESRQMRERVRDFARARLAQPSSDAYLAEIIAAESDY
jgi:hypothetical protein